MSKEYHYLVAGLPDILLDTSKLNFTIQEFKSYLFDELSEPDYELIESYFWRYDNFKLLYLLSKQGGEILRAGNLDNEDFDEILALAKDDALKDFEREIPSYIGTFIQNYKDDSAKSSVKSWENQLTELYYEYLLEIENDFFKEWYQFEMDLNNILTASYCKKFQINLEPELIGNSEINEKLLKSSARDFGLGNELPKIELILRAIDESDMLEREKKIDLIKWDLLDERTFFHYFTIEKIFAYTLKLDMIERWIKLDKKTGEELFNKLLTDLEAGQKFSEEFGQK